MDPVEVNPLRRSRMRPEESSNRLEEADNGRQKTEDGMWIPCRRPSLQLDKNQDETRYGQRPCQHHEKPMPLK